MALYVPLQEVAKWTVLATLGVGILAKGKGRLLVLGAALSIFLVNILLGCWKS
jgi:4-amino-4-deoxy-L-arabinose transferase-like glycosyltransferase